MAEINKETCMAVINIIDVCVKRGAFEGKEIESVATLRRAMVNLVNSEERNETQNQTFE